jgi:hypothetical protein
MTATSRDHLPVAIDTLAISHDSKPPHQRRWTPRRWQWGECSLLDYRSNQYLTASDSFV